MNTKISDIQGHSCDYQLEKVSGLVLVRGYVFTSFMSRTISDTDMSRPCTFSLSLCDLICVLIKFI